MTNPRRFIRIVFLIFLLGGSPALGQRIGSEEYRIYSTVLKDVDSRNREDGYSVSSYLVIIDRTEFDKEYSSGRESRDLYRSLEKRNIRPTIIERQLAIFGYGKTYHLASRKEVDALIEQSQNEEAAAEAAARIKSSGPCNSSWKHFYKKFPDASGYLILSRVGFSRGFAVVVVKNEDVCGNSSTTYVLKRRRGRWRVYASYGSGGVA